MMKQVKASKKHLIEVLNDYGIDSSDAECVKEFEIWKCCSCHNEIPVSCGNAYSDRLSESVYICDECGKSHKMN